MLCSHCGKTIPDGSAACPECGASLSDTKPAGSRKKLFLGAGAAAAVVLLLAVLFFTGVIGPRTVVGNWKCRVDFTSALKTQISEGDPAMLSYLDPEDVFLTATFSFRDDGTYETGFDEESVREAFESVIGSLKTALTDYMTDAAKEQDMSLDELMKRSGYGTIDDFLEYFTQQFDVNSFIDAKALSGSGRYLVEGNRIYLSSRGEPDPGTSPCYEYRFAGRKLVLTGAFGGSKNLLDNALLPLELTRR